MRKSAVSKKTANKKEKVPDDKKSTKKGAASRAGSSSSQRANKEEAAIKKQTSNVSKKSKQTVGNNDAISAKNGVLDNESADNVVENTSPQREPLEEVKAEVPQEEQYQPEGTGLA